MVGLFQAKLDMEISDCFLLNVEVTTTFKSGKFKSDTIDYSTKVLL